jgi:SSS family transporter
MTTADYLVLAFYFAYMVAISWVFRRFVTNVSDYFRGGGKAVWWMVGGSAFMVQFSAWTFTGASSQAYHHGWPIVVIYLGNALGFAMNALHFAPRFRQLRVVTTIEAIRLRFGRASEQVFTWLQLPFGTLQAGIWLNALAVFFTAVFGLDLTTTIAVTGAVVLIIALLGGSWAVLASDFIQVLILMPVCLAVTILALLKLGGVGGFLDRIPAAHLDFSQIFSKDFLLFWCLAMLLKQFVSTNNLFDANRYLCVKDGRHARWAGFLASALMLFGIVIWFIPPMAAAALCPDLAAQFPGLKNPEEAAFIAISREVMPVGMMGLLVSGIFAATMSSMDAGLNKNAGIFIKNFYQPILRPAATDAHLLKVGKVATTVLGVIVILVALKMAQLKDLTLFQLTQRVSILIGVPITVPLVLGLLVKHTPPWSAWSTVLVGFVSSLLITEYLTPEWAAAAFNVGAPLDKAAREYWRQGIELFGNISVGTLWFLGTKLYWDRCTEEHRTLVADFYARLNRPVDFAREEGAANDSRQATVVGWLCVAYGGFLTLLALIPNPLIGRLAFLGCGAVVLAIAGALLAAGRAATASANSPTPSP